MPARMELRKHVKAPRRYSHEIEEDSPPTSPTKFRLSKPCPIKAKITQYNPDLPPAAFPTLDPRTTLACDTSQSEKLSDRQTDARKHDNARSSTSLSSTERELMAQQQRSMSTTPTTMSSIDNGPGNRIWEKNMKKMDEMSMRSEEEWFARECETSSEEDFPTRSASSVTLWDDIPLALQIKMVYAATRNDNLAHRSMGRLKLNQTQQEAMLDELLLYQAREKADVALIACHLNRLNDILLNGRRSQLNEDQFQDFYERLVKTIRKDIVASVAQVMDAKAYMESCGLDSSELDRCLPKEITDSNEELERRYPHAPKINEVMAADELEKSKAAAKETLSNEATTRKQESSHAQVYSPLSGRLVATGEVETNGEGPAFKKRKITSETIEVDVGDRPLLGSDTVQKKVSTTTKENGSSTFGYLFEDYPRTPEQSTRQGLAFDQPLVEAIRFVGWPATPPTPSQGVVPHRDSGESEYEPKSKEQPSKNTSSSKAALTPGFGRAPGSGGTPVARTTSGILVMLSPKVAGKEINGAHTDRTRQSHAIKQKDGHMKRGGSMVDAPSSSATTEHDSTIVVNVQGQQPTVAQVDGEKDELSMGGTDVVVTKTKTKKRGRPRNKPQGDQEACT